MFLTGADQAGNADVPHDEERGGFSCYVIQVKLFFAPDHSSYNKISASHPLLRLPEGFDEITTT